MAQTYAYNWVEIDPETNMCIGMYTGSNYDNVNLPNMMEVPVYSDDYLFKFYINGSWYEDAEGTIPWTPPTE